MQSKQREEEAGKGGGRDMIQGLRVFSQTYLSHLRVISCSGRHMNLRGIRRPGFGFLAVTNITSVDLKSHLIIYRKRLG